MTESLNRKDAIIMITFYLVDRKGVLLFSGFDTNNNEFWVVKPVDQLYLLKT